MPDKIRDLWDDQDRRPSQWYDDMAELEIRIAENGYRREFRDVVMSDSLAGIYNKRREMECALCEQELRFLHGMWWHVEGGYTKTCPRAFKGL